MKHTIKAPKKGVNITQEQLDVENAILNLRRHCLTIKEIAKAVHRSDRYVASILDARGWRRLGLSEVKDMRKSGLSIRAIARNMGISDKTVAKALGLGGKKS